MAFDDIQVRVAKMMMMETFGYSALQGQMEVKELIWTESKF